MVDVLTDTEAMRKRRKEENERSIEGCNWCNHF